MNYVVDWEANQHHDGDGLGNAHFPSLIHHNCDDADQNHADAEDSPKCNEHVARHDRQHDESEYDGNQNALLRWLHKGLFGNHPAQVLATGESTTF